MKKLILLALAALVMAGCQEVKTERDEESGLFTIDSCEYIKCPVYYGHIYIHHNNCRYCEARRKQELKELVEILKDK